MCRERRHTLPEENCFGRRTLPGILATGDGVAVDFPEGFIFLGQLETAIAEGPDVHESLNEGEEQCRGGIQVNILADGAVSDPVGEEFLQAGNVFADRLRRLFVQFSITDADDLGNDLKGESLAQVDCGKVIPDDLLDGVDCNRSRPRAFRRDFSYNDRFKLAEQEGENALLTREVTVDSRFGNTYRRGDPLNGEVFTTIFKDELCRGIEYLLLPEFR